MSRSEKWKQRLEASNHSLVFLFFASMAESTIVPIPLETILIPFMLNNRDRLWRLAASVTAGCLVGAAIGYGVGMLFYESAGRWFVETFDYEEQFQRFRNVFNHNGFFAVLSLGISPVPFQVAMLAAGVSGYSLVMFLTAATIARGIRYFGIALLVLWFGDKAVRLWKKQRALAVLILLGIVAALYLLTHWLSH